MTCDLCFVAGQPDEMWRGVYREAAICPACARRAREEHGPGWALRVQRGCYAGGRPDPRYDVPPFRGSPDFALHYLHDALGPPEVISIRWIDRDYPEVIYDPDLCGRGIAVLFRGHGRRAGERPAIFFRDAHDHLEARIRWRINASLKELGL